jgi:hypothetical protein
LVEVGRDVSVEIEVVGLMTATGNTGLAVNLM